MTEVRDKIRRWTHEGVPFRLIGDRINALPSSEEEKSALWLWAWSHQRRQGQRHQDRPRSEGRLLAD
jgi:hypothetical protein